MYLAAAALTIPILLRRRQSQNQSTNNKGALLGLALAAGVTNVAFVVALIEGEVMRVMLLFYLSLSGDLILSFSDVEEMTHINGGNFLI